MRTVIQGLEKSYQQGSEQLAILRNLSFSLDSGETLAILGQSGSGKSTLLSLMAGLDSPDQGSIEYDGLMFHQLSESERTRFRGKNIGMVFQSHHLVRHLTALENVMLPLEILGRPEVERPAREILNQMGLGSRLNHSAMTLSGGEAQRVAIARALVIRPRLVLADEPSGQLDQATAKSVMDQFFKMLKEEKSSLILVTHDSELAKKCDRTLRLNQGVLET